MIELIVPLELSEYVKSHGETPVNFSLTGTCSPLQTAVSIGKETVGNWWTINVTIWEESLQYPDVSVKITLNLIDGFEGLFSFKISENE